MFSKNLMANKNKVFLISVIRFGFRDMKLLKSGIKYPGPYLKKTKLKMIPKN